MNGLLRLVRQHKHLLIGLALGLLALLTIVATLGDIGLTWDEPLYIKAARGYMSWLGLLRRDPTNALSDSVIVRWWVQDPTLELHPPLGKLLSGLTWAAFRTVVGDISAHRLANAGLFSLLVAMVYWLVSSAYGTPSGVFAALALLLVAGVVKERFLKRPSLVFMAVLFGVAAALRLYFGVETGDWQWPLTRTELYLALVTPAALATARWRVSEDPREDTHD